MAIQIIEDDDMELVFNYSRCRYVGIRRWLFKWQVIRCAGWHHCVVRLFGWSMILSKYNPLG